MSRSFPLESLPESLVLHACSKIASSSSQDFHNLTRVSRTFNSYCNKNFVLRHVTFEGIPLRPWFTYPDSDRNFDAFTQRCMKAGNPEAEFRVGVAEYFDPNSGEQQQEEGLGRIASAAGKGVEVAKFFYGSILICLGAENRRKGSYILNPFIIPSVPSPHNSLYAHSWMLIISDLIWPAQAMVNRLKSNYVREACNCDGPKYGLFEDPGTFTERFHRFQILVNLIPSLSCPICFCHHVVQIFFDLMELNV